MNKGKRKTCLITGASGDIGYEIVKQVVAEGYQVILHGNKNVEKLEELMNGLPEGSVLSYIQADLSTEEGIRSLVENLFFHVDSYVHASGKAYYGLFQETDDHDMKAMLNLHVYAPWKISKSLLPSMIQRQDGHIILISSIWGEVGASHEVVYSSVKGAQNSFVKALAKEVGPSNIKVNAISPGYIETKMNSQLTDEEKNQIVNLIPAKRTGTPQDIAHMVTFLLHSKSNYINGQILRVDGGWI